MFIYLFARCIYEYYAKNPVVNIKKKQETGNRTLINYELRS